MVCNYSFVSNSLSHEKICWRSICIQFFLSWAFVSLAVQIYFTFNTSLISKIFDNDLLKVIALKNARIVTGIGSSKLVINIVQDQTTTNNRIHLTNSSQFSWFSLKHEILYFIVEPQIGGKMHTCSVSVCPNLDYSLAS